MVILYRFRRLVRGSRDFVPSSTAGCPVCGKIGEFLGLCEGFCGKIRKNQDQVADLVPYRGVFS
ncbi:hypothetical protein FYZ35_10580 [Mobiluncus mulieris]|nr:hypothetical protein [Mobiluncus mulieris]MCU9993015.1 hypothetical protein [Mobiluncus mulieris]